MPEKRGPTVETIPPGDNRSRLTCPDCGFVRYENPKIVVGAVCTWQDKVLLCRRAIPPQVGFWTIPAGFMEMSETTAEGAVREVLEEAGAQIEIGELIGIYDIPRISQVYVIYAARMTAGDVAAGIESQNVGLFAWDDVPWGEIAFPSITWALKRFRGEPGPAFDRAPRTDLGLGRP